MEWRMGEKLTILTAGISAATPESTQKINHFILNYFGCGTLAELKK